MSSELSTASVNVGLIPDRIVHGKKAAKLEGRNLELVVARIAAGARLKLAGMWFMEDDSINFHWEGKIIGNEADRPVIVEK
jgi:hypothetical protein